MFVERSSSSKWKIENKDKYINTFIKKVNEVIIENNNFNSDKIKEDNMSAYVLR